MAKSKTVYVCEVCNAREPKWVGKCSVCGSWNSFREVQEVVASKRRSDLAPKVRPLKLSEVCSDEEHRLDTGDAEFNRVLGGGLVPGSIVLLGGEPGIGKSTLVLQFALSQRKYPVLYMSGEESISQIKMRAERIGNISDSTLFVSGVSLEQLMEIVAEAEPAVLIIDSIQTLASENLDAMAGSITQIRESASAVLKIAKERGMAVIIIGHITKEGSIAGPKILEHMVDTVLQFEGDQQHLYRILRAVKNRFGSTSEIGIYEMTDTGLRQVSDPSEFLIYNRTEDLSGVIVGAPIEGIRPILLEVQALVSTAVYGTPQRSATGFDTRRLNMLLAVLEKRVGFRLAAKDVFLNMAGGIKVGDPALDMAVAMAVLSSNMDTAVGRDSVFVGEVGLSGEIRAVSRIEQRIAEACKLGFKRIFIPFGNKKSISRSFPGVEILPVSKVSDAVRLIF